MGRTDRPEPGRPGQTRLEDPRPVRSGRPAADRLVAGFAFVADGQAPVAGQPCDRPFDHPPVFAEFVAGFDACASDARVDPALAEPVAQGGNVVGLVGVQFGRFPSSWSAAGADGGDRVDQGFECVAVVGVGRGDAAPSSPSAPPSPATRNSPIETCVRGRWRRDRCPDLRDRRSPGMRMHHGRPNPGTWEAVRVVRTYLP